MEDKKIIIIKPLTKICTLCNIEKDVDHFYSNRGRCKQCHVQSVKKRYVKNKDKVLSYIKDYQKKYKDRINTRIRKRYAEDEEYRKSMQEKMKKRRLDNKMKNAMEQIMKKHLDNMVPQIYEIVKNEFISKNN